MILLGTNCLMAEDRTTHSNFKAKINQIRKTSVIIPKLNLNLIKGNIEWWEIQDIVDLQKWLVVYICHQHLMTGRQSVANTSSQTFWPCHWQFLRLLLQMGAILSPTSLHGLQVAGFLHFGLGFFFTGCPWSVPWFLFTKISNVSPYHGWVNNY